MTNKPSPVNKQDETLKDVARRILQKLPPDKLAMLEEMNKKPEKEKEYNDHQREWWNVL